MRLPFRLQRFAKFYHSRGTKYFRNGNELKPPFWKSRRFLTYATLGSAGTGIWIYTHLDEAPITGRRRFLSVSPKVERWMTQSVYQQLLLQFQGRILSQNHPLTLRVKRVVERLAGSLDYFGIKTNIREWKVNIVNAPIQNAFVLPTGEIFLFTGILGVADNEDGIATVLGHEMAHAIARHPAENMSLAQLVGFALFLFKFFVLGDISDPLPNMLANLMLQLPFSRRIELEADRIGLLLMARACYDPHESVRFWKRMSAVGTAENVPALLSTHPASKKRIEKLGEWIPEAIAIRENSDCFSIFRWIQQD